MIENGCPWTMMVNQLHMKSDTHDKHIHLSMTSITR